MVRFLSFFLVPGWAIACTASFARAERFEYWPTDDVDDGQLADGVLWDAKLRAASVGDLLLNVGREGGTTWECALPFALPDLSEGQWVADARLRLSEQGGTQAEGLTVRITAARTLDPLAVRAGPDRFALPRTAALSWSITAPWDSSGQLVAKWEETPNLAPIVNEVLALPGWGASARILHLFLEVETASATDVVRFDETHPRYVYGGNAGIRPARLVVAERFRDAFWGRELLCRPQPDRVELNVVPHEDADLELRFGPAFGAPTRTVRLNDAPAGVAVQLVMDSLEPDTRYSYRLATRRAGSTVFEEGEERIFRTLPVASQEVRFAVTSDLHVTNTSFEGYWADLDLLEISLDHLAARFTEGLHFWMDLGDLVVIRAVRGVLDEEETEQRYREAREYVERVAHSIPFVFVRGNHEEVSGWGDDGSGENDALWSGRMLLKYFPPPLPDDFVSGNTAPRSGLGLPGNYFAFTAGNMRLRCGDPFLATLVRPHNGHGEVGGSLDPWDWTLGQAQYDWLAADLAEKRTPYSVFAIHHLTSSYERPTPGYGRGGIEVAKYSVAGRPSFEWGGEDTSGAYVLDQRRPFESGAPHDLLASAGCQVLLKGHDHFGVRQILDGMIYQTVPKLDDTGARTGDLWGWRPATFYPEELSIFRENSGYLTVSADDEAATWSYVRTYPPEVFGMVSDSFTVLPDDSAFPPPSPRVSLVRNVSPNPFRHQVRIEYDIARAGETSLSIYDVAGRFVASVFRRVMEPGTYETTWDGKDRNGRAVASGVYFARLRSGDRVHAERLIARH
jgi:hypothetical protein